MLNVSSGNLHKVVGLLPALHRPTVSPLTEEGWFALTTVVDEVIVRDVIPELIAAGAEGIVEYALNKVVP
jgi:ATP phosphoribosyltransferase